MRDAGAASSPDGRSAMVAHVRSAARDAVQARFRSEQGLESRAKLLGSPRLCVGVAAALLAGVAVWSGGLAETRELLRGPSYPDPARVVVLAQGGPFFGIRLGFRDRDFKVFRERSESIDGIAAYVWYSTAFGSGATRREFPAANVSPDFFQVLHVPMALGQDLQQAAGAGGFEPFLVSHEFWRGELGRDPSAIGRSFQVGGRPMKLAGVLPPGFTFLSASMPIWTARTGELPQPTDARWARWWSRWRGLKGAVARLGPGETPESAARELRDAQLLAGVARRNYRVYATAVSDLEYRALRMYGSALLACLAALFLWAGFNLYRNHRERLPRRATGRYWSFFVLKTAVPLAALFFFIFECTGVSELRVTGGVWLHRELFAVWLSFCGVGMTAFWAWRDQRGRCRICLHRMRHPVQIGVPGLILLDTSGLEVLCPNGHGSIYTSESMLGSDISDRWIGFEDPEMSEAGEPAPSSAKSAAD
jgi:hypothetical protein